MSHSSQSPAARPPQRILLVDDDELELELMSARLGSLGFETHTVSDGGAALELLRTQSFPVVITDWQMPRMDGIETTESLRTLGDNETYIIMLTVLDDHSSHERGYFAGVDDYLSKRAPDAKIVASVRAAFRAVEMRQALHAAGQVQGSSMVSDAASGVLAARWRADIDFVTRYRGFDGVQRLAVILPETERAVATAVGGRLSGVLATGLQTPLHSFVARVGCASFIPIEEAQPSQHISANIEGLLREAEVSARVAPSSASPPRRSEAG